MIAIYRDIDNVATEVCAVSAKQAYHKTAIMGADEVQISVTVDSALDIKEGDYIILDGINYTLNRDAECIIASDVNLTYDMVFEHPLYTLLNKLYSYRMTKSTNFTLTGKLFDFVEMVVWNLNKSESNILGVDTGWSIGALEDTEYKNIQFVDVNCKEALDILAEEFEVEYRFENKKIYFEERVERVTEYVFEQGREKGLYQITQQNVDKEDTVTRLYVRGGNKNILSEYADDDGYLMLPENYLENFSDHSQIVERKVRFEDEYPKFLGEVATVSGTNNEIITCPEIDFDIQQLAIGDNARINFLNGDLTGVSFQFQWDYSEKKITLLSQEDETVPVNSEGVRPSIPSALRKPRVGDNFNFTGILMPQSYIQASIDRLRTKGQKRLNFFSKKRVKYSVDIDHRFLRGKSELKVGDLVVLLVSQTGLLDTIRITELEKNLRTGAVEATISNYLEQDWSKDIEGRISEVTNQILSGQTGIQIVDGVVYRDRGIWSLLTAQGNPYLKNAKINDTAWHNGNKWLCMVNGTTAEPSFSSNDWKLIEGRSDIRMEFDSSNGYAFFAGAVQTTITPIVFIGNIVVSDDIPQANWKWERVSGNTTADNIWNAQHKATKVLDLNNEDMGTNWGRNNPVRFTCTATYPNSLNEITNYIDV